jgi:hypothetical protein
MWLATLIVIPRLNLMISDLPLEFGEQVSRRRSKNVMNFVDLVELVVAREERVQREHFKVHASDSPVVHFVVVVAVG